MSILQCLTPEQRKQLSQSDHDYLKRKLAERTMLSRLLNKPVNQQALHELQCILDNKPVPRQNTGQCVRGQVSRLTDGVRYPCHTRKMTPEEMVKYEVKEVSNGK